MDQRVNHKLRMHIKVLISTCLMKYRDYTIGIKLVISPLHMHGGTNQPELFMSHLPLDFHYLEDGNRIGRLGTTLRLKVFSLILVINLSFLKSN